MKGCGCQTGILRYIKIPYSQLFYTACCIHDDDYDRGGDSDDRYIADLSLKDNMRKTIRQKNYGLLMRAWLQVWVFVFFASVRMFGSFYFNYHK